MVRWELVFVWGAALLACAATWWALLAWLGPAIGVATVLALALAATTQGARAEWVSRHPDRLPSAER